MKKLFLAFLLVAPLLNVGCGKDEENGNPMVGTRWVCDNRVEASILSGIQGRTFVHVFEFKTNEEGEMYFYASNGGVKDVESTFRYEYVDDRHIEFINADGTRTSWYFLSPTELCNKTSKMESYAYVYRKQ